MIASWMPVHAIVHATASRRAARMLYSADVARVCHDPVAHAAPRRGWP